jgi:hypothetical protein
MIGLATLFPSLGKNYFMQHWHLSIGLKSAALSTISTIQAYE